MLVELFEPVLRDENASLLVVFLSKFKALLVSFLDDPFKVISSEGPEHPEEELSLWQPVGKLLLVRKIAAEHAVLHGILVQVLD